MKTRFVLLIAFVVLFAGVKANCCTCSIYLTYDKIWVEEPEAHSDSGYVDFTYVIYTTCANGDSNDDELPTLIMEDDCHAPYNFGANVSYAKRTCAMLCYPCWCRFPCLGIASHFISEYKIRVRYSGHFFISMYWRGAHYGTWEFEFPKNNETRIPDFREPIIFSSIDEMIPSYGTIDVDERIKIRTWARWSENPEQPDRIIDLIVKSSAGDDSIVTTSTMTGTQGDWVIYETSLLEGSLRSLYNNPVGHFSVPRQDVLTAYPRKTGCITETYTGPTTRCLLTMQKIWVEEVSFMDDIKLCKEKYQGPPHGQDVTENIDKPQWSGSGANEPVCYIRDNPIKMDAKLRVTFTPYHTFNVMLKIIPDNVDTGFTFNEINVAFDTSSSKTIKQITSTENLPNSIGLSSMDLYWAFYVTNQSRRWSTETGPHKFYRIYDTPINSHTSVVPVNVDACLEKVCVDYARNQDSILAILSLTSSGIEQEGYGYSVLDTNGLYLFDDPLDIYRYREGECFDFSRYMTACAHSIGIAVNVRSITSGELDSTGSGTIWHWINTYYSTDRFCKLWTVGGLGGNLPDGAYDFLYHMVTKYTDISDTSNVVEYIYDPIWNINGIWNDWYPQEFRYYYNTNCDSTGPPSTGPAFYDWPKNVIPNTQFPNNLGGDFDNCRHP